MTAPSGPSLRGQAGRRVQALLDSLQIDQAGDQWSLLPFLLATVELPLAGLVAAANNANGGVALERNGIQLLNPAESGVDIHVISIYGRGDSAAAESNIHIMLHDTALSTAVTGNSAFLDTFQGTQPPVGLIFSEADWTVAGLRIEQNEVLKDTSYVSKIAPHLILRPGSGVVTTPSVVDEDQLANFVWREAPSRR